MDGTQLLPHRFPLPWFPPSSTQAERCSQPLPLEKHKVFLNVCVYSYWEQCVHEGYLLRRLLSVSLPLLQSWALRIGKEECFLRNTAVGSFNTG